MKRRRTETSSSSLDLFLDTICNAFAGIMFIAILLSIVTQLRSYDSKANDSGAQRESDIQRLEDLLARVRELESAIESVRSLAQREDGAELLEEQRRMQASLSRLSSLTAEHVRLVEELSELVKKNASLKQELATLDEEMEKLKQQLQNRSGEFDTLRAERVVAIEVPEVRATTKGNLLFLMKYGKCFSVHDESETSFNTSQVEIEQTSGNVYVRPKADAGWDLEQPVDSASLSQFLRTFSANDRVVTVGVWPDSFGEFASFKKKLIELGFEYELVPLDATDRVPVGSASRQAKVQ